MQIHQTVDTSNIDTSNNIFVFNWIFSPFQRNVFQNFEFAKDRISIHFKFINFKKLSKTHMCAKLRGNRLSNRFHFYSLSSKNLKFHRCLLTRFDHDFCSNFLEIVILKQLRVSIDRFPSNSPLLKSFTFHYSLVDSFIVKYRVQMFLWCLKSSFNLYAIEIINQGFSRIRYNRIVLIFQINMWNSMCLQFPIFDSFSLSV